MGYNSCINDESEVYMAAMKELWEEINYLLDTTKWSCEEIANYCSCPVDMVNGIVEQRWNERVAAA
jgi:8-oxo-dGTP pyrophosphatase MutT (NUDIX family)